MSASDGLLPAKLKWVIVGCFAGLMCLMIFVYLTSPKLIMDEATSIQSVDVADIQSTPSSSPKQQAAASPSAELQTSHDQPSVHSMVDQGSELPVPTEHQSKDQPPHSTPTPSAQAKQDCDYSNDSSKKIVGVTLVGKVKAYLTPMHQAYQVYVQKVAKNSQATWYCTENEAKQAGLIKPALDLRLQL